MKQMQITVSCDRDGCQAEVTVVATSTAAMVAKLAEAGWPQTRGRGDFCPEHRRKAAARADAVGA